MSMDIETAEKEFRKAAEQGDPSAQFYLGHAHFMQAHETNGDYETGLTWIRKAAAQNFDQALSLLGYLYQCGEAVPHDLAASRNWYLKAAEQGHVNHQTSYAVSCYNGDFGTRDFGEAEIWFLKAAEQGSAGAHQDLGGLYSGFLGPKEFCDLVKSYFWYTLASLQDQPGHSPKLARKARDHVAESMKPEQIAEAENRVQSWLQEHTDVMGVEMAEVWRDRVADPLSPEDMEKLRQDAQASMHLLDLDDEDAET